MIFKEPPCHGILEIFTCRSKQRDCASRYCGRCEKCHWVYMPYMGENLDPSNLAICTHPSPIRDEVYAAVVLNPTSKDKIRNDLLLCTDTGRGRQLLFFPWFVPTRCVLDLCHWAGAGAPLYRSNCTKVSTFPFFIDSAQYRTSVALLHNQSHANLMYFSHVVRRIATVLIPASHNHYWK